MTRWFLFLLLLCACKGESGTIVIEVIESPGSGLLDSIDSVQATFSNPERVVSAERDADGLHLALTFEADDSVGTLRLTGFDEDGARVAVGQSGPVPLSAIDGELRLLLAPPMSLVRAPADLETPRFFAGALELSYGAVLVGGEDSSGALPNIDIYSTYLHEFNAGANLPQSLAEPIVATASSGIIYIVGGRNEDGELSSASYGFSATTGSIGAYFALIADPAAAQAGKSVAPLGRDLFFVAGSPALTIDAQRNRVAPVDESMALDGQAAPVLDGTGLKVLIAGEGVLDGAQLFTFSGLEPLAAPAEVLRTDHVAVLLPQSGDVLLLGGAIAGIATTTAVRFSPMTQEFSSFDFLATPRRNPKFAATEQYLIVSGGEADDGNVVADVEVFELETLEPVAVLPLAVPRRDHVALSLRNGQILIAGGRDANGDAIAEVEIFTSDEL